MESSQFESSSGVVPKTTLLFYENFGPLFDLICADYVTARYASEENAKRVFYGALKKLYLTIHAESSILPLPSAANHLPILCADHDFQYKAHIRYEKLSKALQNASKQPDAFYSEEVCIRQVLKEHLKRFVDEIVQKKAFRKLLHEELPTPDFLPHEDAFPASFSASASAAAVHLISPPPLYGEIRMEGWLRKKGQHVNFWRERYFMIRSSTNGTHYLCYFRKKGDREPRGWYVLGPGTLVDDVRESPSKIETKKLFTFRISNYTHTSFDEAHLDEMCPSHGLDVPLTRSASGLREGQAILENQANGTFVSENEEGLRRKSSGTFRSRAAAAAAAATAATAVVLTGGLAGVGIGVGMGMSAAAAAAASASAAGAYMNQQQGRQHGTVALAAESYETAIWWRNSVLDCILQAEEQWRQYLQWYMDQQTSEPLEHLQTSTKPRSGSFGTIPRSLARSFKRTFSKKASWKLYAFSSQLRVYKEHPSTTVSSLPPAFRTSLKVDASPKAVFDAIMHTNSSFYLGNHIIQDANVVEAHEKDHSDIVCWKLAPIFLWPVYTAPRELCLLRYWRKEQDESFFICFQSTSHPNCPISKDAVPTAVVLTGGLAGVGIGVGMGMSAAAAAAASASAAGAYMNQQQGRQHGTVALAAESYETAIWWRNSVLDCILQAEEQWRQYLQWYMDQQTSEPLEHLQTSTKPRSGSFGTIPRSLARSFKRTFSKKASWKLYAFSSQLRVYKEHPSTTVSSLPPAFRTSLKVDASPKAVFDAIMHTNSSFYLGNHIIQDANVVEAHEKDHSDIVCWKLAPIFLWPVYTAPRELCLLRYWRKEQDESFFICFQSTSHPNCPISKDAVRATMLGGGFILSPSIDGSPGCWVTLTSQLNPNGYIDTAPGRSWHFMAAYATHFLQIISHLQNHTYTATHIRDKVHIDSPKLTHPSKIQLLPALRTELSVRHCLATKYWSEPCAQSFLVRGEQYRSSGIKVPSERQAFRLFGVVLFGSETPIERIGTAGIEGLSGRIDSPTQSWVWIVHLMLPGPPFHSLVLYFILEDSNFLRKSPSNLCHAFMQGPSDTFRQDRLKVIPRVEQGSRSIRNGIGTTPTILGRKMYQQYHREAQCLEIDYDITSSSVASEMTKLLLGCCDRLVVDLAFVIEGKTDDELPERVLGTVRLRNVTLSDAVPFGGAGERSDL
ncbi:hypothetical protein ABG067_005086 [Albugo candida]